MLKVLYKSHKCEADKKMWKVILRFRLAEQIFQDSEREHIIFPP